jgi:Zn-dependent peptidase ImmA (M78 family)
MPAEEIEPWLPRRASQIDVVQRASETWGVCMQALLYRARTLRTLNETSYTRALRRMNALPSKQDQKKYRAFSAQRSKRYVQGAAPPKRSHSNSASPTAAYADWSQYHRNERFNRKQGPTPPKCLLIIHS